MKRIVRDTALAALIGLIPACGTADPVDSMDGKGGAGMPTEAMGGNKPSGTAGKPVVPAGTGGMGMGGMTGSGGTMMPGGAGGVMGGQGGAKTDAGGMTPLPGMGGMGMGGTMMGMGGGTAACPATGSYFPLAVGNKWTYKVTDGTVVTTKIQTALAMEAVGGTGPSKAVMAFKMESAKTGGMTGDKTWSWQGIDGTKVVRYREQSFVAGSNTVDVEDHWMPARLRVDNAFMGTRMEAYTEFKQQTLPTKSTTECMHVETWTVVGTNLTEKVGTMMFSNVLKVKKKGVSSKCTNGILMTPSLEKTYLFARCIGKIKEEPGVPALGGQVEELTAWTVK